MTSQPQSPLTKLDRVALARVCERFGVCWLAVFGSVARDEFRPDSDIDVLVDFVEGKQVTYFLLVDLAEALSELFQGRRVDLGRPKQLHWSIRRAVLNEAQVLHAA